MTISVAKKVFKEADLPLIRCYACEKILGRVRGMADIRCPRCRTFNTISNQNDEQKITFKTVHCKCGKILAEGTPGSTVRGYCRRCKELTTIKIK